MRPALLQQGGTLSDDLSILIVDDHEAVRDGLRFTLDHSTGFNVVEQMGRDGEEAVNLASVLRPDMVLMDVKMPRMTGVEAAVKIMAARSTQAIILFSAHDEPGLLTDALRAGCRGYILKSAPSEDIVRAIRLVCGGGIYIDPALAHELVTGNIEDTIAKLTPREAEVLQLMANGDTFDAAAEHLYLSKETVRSHVKHCCHKLRAANKTHAVAIAMHLGLIHPPS